MADEHNIELTPEIRVEDVVKSAKRLRAAMQSVFDGTEGKQLDSRLQSMKYNMEDLAKKSDTLTAKIEKLGKAKVETEQYKDIQAAIDETTNKLRKLEKAQEDADKYGGRRSKSYKKRSDEIEELRQILEEQKQYRSQMLQEGTAYISGAESEEYRKLIDQQEQLNNKMRVYTESWNEAVSKQDQMAAGALLKEQRQELTGMTKTVTGLSSTLRGLGRIIPGVSTRGVMATSMIIRGVTKLSSLTRKDLVVALNVARAAFSKLFATIMAHPIVATITAILVAVVALVKVLKKAIDDTKQQLEELGKILSKYVQKSLKDIQDLIIGLGRSFTRFYTSGLKLLARGAILLLSKLKSLQSTVTEGLKAMAQWRDGANKVNETLSNLTSSLEYVKLSLATAFAPIVEVIEPLLTRLLNLLAEVITSLGMFMAKLTGATSFQKAIRQQKDYAKSLKGVGSAADEAKQKLASYDKLQVISQDNSSGGGSAASMFEEVSLQDFELPEWLNNLFDLGQKVGSKLRDVLNDIPWEKVQKGSNKAARGIADFVNGLMSTSSLGESVGRTLGNVSNTITTFINTLLVELDGTKIGKQLRGIFDSLLQVTDFKSLGNIFSNAVNGFVDFLIGVFSEPGLGKTIGIKISEFLEGTFGELDWTSIGKAVSSVFSTLSELANALITPENFGLLAESFGKLVRSIIFSISNFVATADWDQFGESIATAVNTFFSTVNWEFSGETLSNLAKNLLNMLLKAVNSVNWDKVGDALIEFLTSIDWKDISKKAKEISTKLREGLQAIWKDLSESAAFDEIIDLIVDFLKEKKNWEKAFKRIKNEIIRKVFVEKVVSSLKDFFRVEEFMDVFEGAKEAFKEGGVHILEGIGLGIFGALDMLFGWALSIFEGLWNAICNVFGIHSPSTEMEPIGKNIILGIIEGFGLVDFAKKIGDWWNENVAPWFTLKKWKEVGQGIVDGLSEKLNELKSSWTEKWQAIRDKTIEIVEGIKEGIKAPINAILSGIEAMINGIVSGLNLMINAMNKLHFDIPDWVPQLGGKSFGFSIPNLSSVSIPRLAQGAVIPPNKEFAAILGDQKSGVNIETPLETMIKAFKQALSEMGGSNQPIILQLNGRVVAQVVWDEEAKRYKQINRYQAT